MSTLLSPFARLLLKTIVPGTTLLFVIDGVKLACSCNASFSPGDEDDGAAPGGEAHPRRVSPNKAAGKMDDRVQPHGILHKLLAPETDGLISIGLCVFCLFTNCYLSTRFVCLVVCEVLRQISVEPENDSLNMPISERSNEPAAPKPQTSLGAEHGGHVTKGSRKKKRNGT